MVSSGLGNITDKLSDLGFRLQVSLEAAEHDLALTWLEAINNRRDGSNVVGHREQNEFLVDEVSNGNLAGIVVEVSARLVKWSISLIASSV